MESNLLRKKNKVIILLHLGKKFAILFTSYSGTQLIEMTILNSILSLKESPKDQKSLKYLVEISFQVSKSYMERNRSRIKFLQHCEDETLNENALEAITPFFSPDDSGNYSNLIKPFENWKPEIKSEEEAAYFLNRVIAKRVEQYLASRLRELDPVFSKILDSVNYLVKKGNYRKYLFLGKRFIIPPGTIEFGKNFITAEKFNSIPVSVFTSKNELLENLFGYLCDHTDYEAAIPVNALVLKLKHISSEDFLSEKQKFNFPVRMDINEVIESGFETANNRLINFYLAKKKLNEPETESFRKALKDMAEDLKDGGLNPGLYSYLQPYLPSLSKDEYTVKYHNKLEYLLKVMKSTIAEKLQE